MYTPKGPGKLDASIFVALWTPTLAQRWTPTLDTPCLTPAQGWTPALDTLAEGWTPTLDTLA